MVSIDENLTYINNVICNNLDQVGTDNRGFISQNILAQLRNFVELIILKIDGRNLNPNIYDQRVHAINKLKKRPSKDNRFILEFYNLLQESVSHYTVDQDGSERLMIKYYEYLLKIKNY